MKKTCVGALHSPRERKLAPQGRLSEAKVESKKVTKSR